MIMRKQKPLYNDILGEKEPIPKDAAPMYKNQRYDKIKTNRK